MNDHHSALFEPLQVRSLALPNRIVMSPMTTEHSPGGVPGADVAAYYRRRAEGGSGLVITEGVAIDHPTAVDSPKVPRLHGEEALVGWRDVVDEVHEAGGRIIPQLWHVGPLWGAMSNVDPSLTSMRPSGVWGRAGRRLPERIHRPRNAPTAAMTEQDLEDVIAAYVRSARNAVGVGFDGIAIHAAHGYLFDSFLWESTNQRTDQWGGDLQAAHPVPGGGDSGDPAGNRSGTADLLPVLAAQAAGLWRPDREHPRRAVRRAERADQCGSGRAGRQQSPFRPPSVRGQ